MKMFSIIKGASPVFTFLLIWYLADAKQEGSFPPQILLPPEDTFPIEGNLEFSCKGTGFPEPNISWHDALTQKILDESSPNIHVNRYVGRLTISDPEVKRAYSVYCNVSNNAGWVASPAVQGARAYLEHDFGKFPIDRSAEKGDLVLLECQPPEGSPTPTTDWLFNNAKLPSGWGLISPEGDLHIREVKPQHMGTYACRAKNIAGERLSPSAILQVKSKSVRFLQKPKDTTAALGSTVTFRCQVDDSEPVVWSKDNTNLAFDYPRVQVFPTSINIQNVQASDAGKYACATSKGLSSEAWLTISGAPRPTLSDFLTDKNATEGETVDFRCRSTSPHKSAIYWDLPNQSTVFPNDQVGNIVVNELGDLQIRGVRLTDSGFYQCSIDSDHGLITKKTRLEVIPSLPPIINLPPANQTRISGATVILDCEVGITLRAEAGFDLTGRTFEASRSHVFWVRGTRSTGGLQERIDFDHQDSDPRFSLLPGGGLQINGVMAEDTGNYTCFLQYEHGPYMQSNWTASLVVLPSGSHISSATEPMDPLSPPENLRVQNQTHKSVTLIWDPPKIRTTNRVSYWIEMFHTAEPELGWQILQESWPRNAIRLEPLLPDSAYYFLIRLRWTGGRIGWAGAPLGPIQIESNLDRSLSRVPGPIKLQGIKIQVLSSTSARVAWSLEDSGEFASELTGFSVRYREVPLTQCTSTNAQDATFCSFRPGELLSQRIHLYQENLNAASLMDTEGVSLVPRQEPEMLADVPFIRDRDFTPPWSIILNHLKPFCCYLLILQPTTRYPKQSKNETALFLVHEDIPSMPPQIVGVKKKSNHSVEVLWAVPPADSWNGLLTGFVVYIFNAAQNDKRELKFNHDDTNGILSGLKAGEIYHLQMAAVNCRGSSYRSIPINFSVSEDGIIRDSSPSTDVVSSFSHFQPWIIGIVVGVLVIWLLAMFLAIIFCLRQRIQLKQRYPPSVGGGFIEDTRQKCATAVVPKAAYNLVPLNNPQSIFGGVSELECPQGGDSASKTPTTSTQPNTYTTIASTNSSSTGGSCNRNISQIYHSYEEGVPCFTTDFSPSPFFPHIHKQHAEHPFLDYRSAEFSNNGVFSSSVIENSPTTTGLPLVAPVAQLAFSNGMASGIEHLISSVTPYATTSLINSESKQKSSVASPESLTPSDMSSNAGGSIAAVVTMHDSQGFSMRPQQYFSRSSSGTTTGAEEDYSSHHHKHQLQQQIPSTSAGYKSRNPPALPPPIPQHQLSAQIPTNGSLHTPVF